ncbi:LD-carboxypeptidase [Flavobacteriaceae bacterium]|nr:LD-carboxypeptidase [Flavobacteriaceae bacterium]MDB4590100.1 LD-carboxypeptidase [Flavobacteriaceae bacterium]|tara:strand:+ start:2008 stop:2907 length:900 start_codon:yes stop_codon:yes gene_type:complete
MIRSNYLQKGDTVAIVSTARKVFEKELIPALSILKNWKLNVVLGTSIEAEEHQFAGNDKLRASDFQEMLDNPKIKAIWCARGGYGTIRMLDLLDFSNFKNNPKWIIGYSDVTVLHSHLHQLGFETLHAQMPVSIETKTAACIQSLKNSLFGNNNNIIIPSEASNVTGNAKGVVVGGNLSMLYSLCGSSSSISTKGKILFIEDLDEYLYHIDRMLQNLKRNGMLDQLEGLIIGGMTQMHDNDIPFGQSTEEIILSICNDYNYPIVFNFPAGHIDDNRALILGRKAELIISKTETILTFDS